MEQLTAGSPSIYTAISSPSFTGYRPNAVPVRTMSPGTNSMPYSNKLFFSQISESSGLSSFGQRPALPMSESLILSVKTPLSSICFFDFCHFFLAILFLRLFHYWQLTQIEFFY